MMVLKVKIKWQKETFNDIQLNKNESPLVFKAQLFALTGVQVERQKLLFRGKVIGDDTWTGHDIKDGATLMLLGTAEELPKAPEEKPKFIEDLNEKEFTKVLDIPCGLANLGNTCYLNATAQCLKTIPELRDALNRLTKAQKGVRPDICYILRQLYCMMDNNAVVSPLILLNVFHMHFPRFAETTENGTLMQHDASECWTEMMRSLQRDLNLDEYKSVGPENEARSVKYNFIEHYFEGQFQVKLKNTESEEEEETKSSERFLQLSCFISHDVKYLQSGLKSKLEESITKYSNILKKDCVYLKKSLLNRLPSHLTVQIMRFEFKEKKSNCAKILKEIKFTLNLDVFELCTPELQSKLMVMRSKFKEEEDQRIKTAQNMDNIQGKGKALSREGSSKDEEGKNKSYRYPYSFTDDPGSNNSGYYELEAVLTHKGREGSSGHYVAWVCRNKDSWFKCDDDNVFQVTTEDILKLAGGGDWHCAYLLFYGPRVLEVSEASAQKMDITSG